MSHLSACDLGRCTDTHTVDERYNFEAKVYPHEDARIIQRATFAQAQIMAHTQLDGEVSTGADEQGSYVTVHEDVKAGTKKRLYRDEIVSNGWYSEITGYGATDCGFVGQSTKREVQIDKFIGSKKVRQEEELCISKLIGTWKQGGLRQGALREGDAPVMLSDDILYAMMKESIVSIDRHAWRGDYGSSDNRYMHTDGYIKIAVNAVGSALPFIVDHSFTGLTAGDAIEGMVGGQSFNIPFNTDTNTTLDDFRTALLLYTDVSGNMIFPTIVNNGAGTLTVTSQDAAKIYDLKFVITDGTGFSQCPDGTLTANVAGAATVATTVTQSAAGGSAPIAIDLLPVTSTNVKDRFKELYSAITDTKAEMLDPDFEGKLFVAPNIWHTLEMYLADETAAYSGSCGPLVGCRNYMGFEIVKMNYLPKDEMFYANAENLHLCTDLATDVTEIRQGFDAKCGTAWFKNAFSLGFAIADTAYVAGTFTNRPVGEFQALMPLDNQ